MKCLRLFPLLALLLAVNACKSQNLLERASALVDKINPADTMPNVVPNPGFEQYNRLACRWTQKISKFNQWNYKWRSATETTPDHFSTDTDRDCWSHPNKRTNGKIRPHDGACMMGLKTWGLGNTPSFWHEYIEVELDEPLQAGVTYVAEFYTQRLNVSSDASNNIGMYFSDTLIATRNNLPLFLTPQVNAEEVIKKKGWTRVRGVFTAKGTEKFLLMGNFYSDDETIREKQPTGERGAYYFIDDVNVRIAPKGTALTPKPKRSVPPPPKKVVPANTGTAQVALPEVAPRVGTSMILDNIEFEFDKATLRGESSAELQNLAHMLIDFPNMRVEIQGHTDDEGADDYNLNLSQARAKAVADRLIKKKVRKGQLTYKGYGETVPIATNDTEEGRAKNRRVQFVILSN